MNNCLQDVLVVPITWVESRVDLNRYQPYPIIQVMTSCGRLAVARADANEGVVAAFGTGMFQWPTLYWVEPMFLRAGNKATFIPLDPCLLPITVHISLLSGYNGRAIARTLIATAQKNLIS